MRVRTATVACLAGAVCVAALPAVNATGAPAAFLAGTAAPAAAPAASSLGTATLAPSLAQLLAEVDMLWPGRSRASDGWVGDGFHQLSRSDHNPVGHSKGPRNGTPGSVHAVDITAAGIDPDALVGAIAGDPRVWYVIFDSQIRSRSHGWKARPYHGDPHSGHVHISLASDDQAEALAAEQDTRPWLGDITPGPELAEEQIRALQQALIDRGFTIAAGPTGYFGPQTRAAVAAFQRSQGWAGADANGVPGTESLQRLGVSAAPAPPQADLPAPAPPQSDLPAPAPPPQAVPIATTAVAMADYAPGVAGEHIKVLQQALIDRGFAIPAGPTGLFGDQTRAAVAAFQSAQGWQAASADGVPGPVTLARLGLSGGAAPSPVAVAAAVAPPQPAAPVAVALPQPAPAAATAAPPVYLPGERGAHITALQTGLIDAGYAIPAGATGFFGAQTLAAVTAFQQAQGWTGAGADGIPGPVTLARLGVA